MSRYISLKRLTTGLFVLFTLLVAVVPAFAQDDPVPYPTRYADIPQSRTEDGAFVLGEPDAPVTIVEFADFMCPHCQDYHPTVVEFIDQFVRTGEAKFEYRMFPIVSPEFSEFTAQLAECSADQNELMFWPAHDLLYDLAAEGRIDLNQTPESLAEILELDLDELNSCVETADQFETDYAVGNAIGVSGTPSVLVRLEDDSLAWPFFDGSVGSGGLQLDGLEALVTAEDINEVVIVPEPLLASLIDGDPCDAPCWNGITPGKTTYEEAKAIIEADRQFIQLEEQTVPEESAILLNWQTYDEYPCCQLYSEDGETVAELFLIATAPVELGTILEANDEPSHALARETDNGDLIVNLFYPEVELVLYVYLAASDEQALTETSDVIGASYVTDERMESLLTNLQPVEWAGLDALEDYLGEATAG